VTRRRGRAGRYWIPLFLLAAVGLCAPRIGFAQDEKKPEKPSPEAPAAKAPAAEAPAAEGEGEEEMDEEERAAKYFADGSKLYTEGKYQDAIGKLLKAYELRPAPPILLNIARTYEKLDNKKNALKFYKEFLLKARMVDPNRPMVEKVVAELDKEVGGSTGAVTSAAGTSTPGAATTSDDEPSLKMTRKAQLIHTPVDAGRYKRPLTLMCETPPDVDGSSVIIYYRRSGEIKFRQVGMDLQGEAWVGQIPGKYITTTSIQYYIEAYQRKGDVMRVAAVYASKRTPNIVVIEGAKISRVRSDAPDDQGDGEQIDKPSSPWRKWVYVFAGVAGAGFVVGGVMGGLAADRSNAVQTYYETKSCTSNECQKGFIIGGKNFPDKSWDAKAGSGQTPQDWESEGKSFNTGMIVGMIIGGLGAAATGAFLYLDMTWEPPVEDDDPVASAPGLRITGSPWATGDGAGLLGRIEF
jgi:tetratricopeptide (TPR) repeat protein